MAAVAGQMEFLLLLEVLVVLDSTAVLGLPVVQIRHTEVAAAAAWDLLARRETVGQESVALASRILDRRTREVEVVARTLRPVQRVDLVSAAQAATAGQPELPVQYLLVPAVVAAGLVRAVLQAAAAMVHPVLL